MSTLKEADAKLNPRQAQFAAAYVATGNATEAAKIAGYSEKTAYANGSRLLKRAGVATAVAHRKAALTNAYDVTAERVVRELALIGFANMLDYVQPREDGLAYVDLSEMTRDQAAAISEMTIDQYEEPSEDGQSKRTVNRVKFKLADKRQALVDLGKHLGLFKAGDTPASVNVQIVNAVRLVGPSPSPTLVTDVG